MEGDSVRTSGENTLVDVWVDGKMRGITVSRQAIVAFLQLPLARAAALTDEECREFVRTNLSRVVSAAKERLRSTNPDASSVAIEAGPESQKDDSTAGERRRGDRRRGERRKMNLGPPPSGERRS